MEQFNVKLFASALSSRLLKNSIQERSGENFGVRWLDTALIVFVILGDFADVVRWRFESGVKPPHSKSFFSALLGLQLFDFFNQDGNCFEEVTDDSIIGDVKNGSFRVFVNSHDRP